MICGVAGKLVINEIDSPMEAVIAIAKGILDSSNSYKVLGEVILHNESVGAHLSP